MYNAHNYAISIERLSKLPAQTANEIEKNPLAYLKSFLDAIYEKDEAKARLIDAFDDKYEQYKDKHLLNWEEADAAQMVKDLREIFS